MAMTADRNAFIAAGVNALTTEQIRAWEKDPDIGIAQARANLVWYLTCIPSTFVCTVTGQHTWTQAARNVIPALPAPAASPHARVEI